MSDELINRQAHLPSYLQGHEETGLETAQQFIVPPRIKIVQKQAKPGLLEKFNPGDVIAAPTMVSIAEMPYDGTKADEATFTPFIATPIFWFAEWCSWNPIDMKADQAVYARTLDPASDIARKSRNKDLWLEPHPDDPKFNLHHVEHIVFAMLLESGPLADMAMVHSFMRGEHKTGSTFLSLLKMRKAPIWSCRFEFSVSQRTNEKGSWYGFDISNPSDEQPWVDASRAELYKAAYNEMKSAHQAGQIQVVHDDELMDEVEDTVAEF